MPGRYSGCLRENKFVKGLSDEFLKDYERGVKNNVLDCLRAMLFILRKNKDLSRNQDYMLLDDTISELIIIAEKEGGNIDRYINWRDRVDKCYSKRTGKYMRELEVDCEKSREKLAEESPRESGDKSAKDKVVSIDINLLCDMGEFIR